MDRTDLLKNSAPATARRAITARLLPAAALLLLAGTAAQAKPLPNLVPHFSVKTGVAAVSNLGPGAATKKTVITVHCSAPGGCPDPTPAQAAPYENPAFPNKVSITAKPLKAGKSFKHKIAFFSSLAFPPGSYAFTVCVDAGGAVAETAEGDNCKRFVKKVAGLKGPGGLTN